MGKKPSLEVMRQRLIEETRKAMVRVGENETAKLNWAIRFAQENLEKLSGGDWNNLQFDIFYFNYEAQAYDTRIDIPSLSLPTPQQIASIQKQTLLAIERIVQRRPLILLTPQLKFVLCPDETVEGKNRQWVSAIMCEDQSDNFIYQLFHLLKKQPERIKRCPECQTLFLADRNNQVFFPKKCLYRASIRKYRERHGLITGRPRGRPTVKRTKKPRKP